MASGMATTKLTITLDEEQVAAVRKLVASGKAKNVSAFVKHAVTVALSDVAGWGSLLASALEETGGPLTRKERAWADSILRAQPRPRRRRRAA
jgi:Arc/MetJ-type ribon-helix-helix transcriptional regulator